MKLNAKGIVRAICDFIIDCVKYMFWMIVADFIYVKIGLYDTHMSDIAFIMWSIGLSVGSRIYKWSKQ